MGAAYDDNIFAAPAHGVADTIFTIEPKILIQSNWNRNALSLTADADVQEYEKHSSENTVQYAFTSAGRLDLQRDFVVNVRAQYEDQVIPRTEAAYVDASLEPLQYQEASGKLELVRTFGNLRLTVGGGAAHDTYLDGKIAGGGVLAEAFRNNTNVSGSARLDYATSPNLALFGEEDVNDFIYDNASDRNSWGTQSLVGVNLQITHLLTGEFGVGYLTQTYDNPLAHDTGTFSGKGQLQWFPTQLVTVTVSGSQALYDSGLTGSPAYLGSNVALQADYELLRNFIISARFGNEWDTYKGIDRRDTTYDASLSANYLLNRSVGLKFTYTRLSLASSGVDHGRRFDDDVVGLALTLRR